MFKSDSTSVSDAQTSHPPPKSFVSRNLLVPGPVIWSPGTEFSRAKISSRCGQFRGSWINEIDLLRNCKPTILLLAGWLFYRKRNHCPFFKKRCVQAKMQRLCKPRCRDPRRGWARWNPLTVTLQKLKRQLRILFRACWHERLDKTTS